MTTYAWIPNELPAAIELRIVPNVRSFTGMFDGSVQTVDMFGERWAATVTLPYAYPDKAAAREAWFDRLLGGAHSFWLWHFGRPAPRGTWGDPVVSFSWTASGGGAFAWTASGGGTFTWTAGTPCVLYPVTQRAGSVTVRTLPGRTVKAGDMFGLGGVQTCRVMADATADGSGQLTVEFLPRARAAIPAYAAINLQAPTIRMMLRGPDGVPATTWRAGLADGCQFDCIEVP